MVESIIYISLSGEDFEWTQNRILELMDNRDRNVVISSIVGLGHLARIHGRIDESRVSAGLERAGVKFDVQGYIESALDDIEMFAREG